MKIKQNRKVEIRDFDHFMQMMNDYLKAHNSFLLSAAKCGMNYYQLLSNFKKSEQEEINKMKAHYKYWRNYYTLDEEMPDYLVQRDARPVENALLGNVNETTIVLISGIKI